MVYLCSAASKTPEYKFLIGITQFLAKTPVDDGGDGHPGNQVHRGVIADGIFVFSDLEYPIVPKLDSFASMLAELTIFIIYLLEDALVKMHFRIFTSARENAFSKNAAPKPRKKFHNAFLNQMYFEL